nr:MAG TPA_asm: hypothetical protein [Caudoviricetes sp.]
MRETAPPFYDIDTSSLPARCDGGKRAAARRKGG